MFHRADGMSTGDNWTKSSVLTDQQCIQSKKRNQCLQNDLRYVSKQDFARWGGQADRGNDWLFGQFRERLLETFDAVRVVGDTVLCALRAFLEFQKFRNLPVLTFGAARALILSRRRSCLLALALEQKWHQKSFKQKQLFVHAGLEPQFTANGDTQGIKAAVQAAVHGKGGSNFKCQLQNAKVSWRAIS